MVKVQGQLTCSMEARLLAIQIAIQDNQSKRTTTVKKVTIRQYRDLLSKTFLDGCVSPLKKIGISCSSSTKSFLIPSLLDIIKQKLLTLALDPQ